MIDKLIKSIPAGQLVQWILPVLIDIASEYFKSTDKAKDVMETLTGSRDSKQAASTLVAFTQDLIKGNNLNEETRQ